MMKPPDTAWIELLRAEAERTSIAATARRLGYSRPAISGVLNGTYRGNVSRIRSRVLAVLGRQVLCPHTGAVMHIDDCRRWRARPMPMGSAGDLKHWRACKRCQVGREFDKENYHAA